MTLIGLLILALGGLIAGIVAGFLGIGGGILTVPILVQLLSFLPNPEEIAVKAVATSSLAVFITSVAETWLGLAPFKEAKRPFELSRFVSRLSTDECLV